MHPLIEQRSKQVPLRRLCTLAGVPRASYYRATQASQPHGLSPANEAVLHEIRAICLEMPRYGNPRVTAELRRRGFQVNHKRVSRLMREANLQCRRKKHFVRTTDSNHNFPVYPNLAKGMVPERPNQLWRADITYIRLLSGFVFLAAILDAFSRKVVGWALARHIDAALSVEALRMAINNRPVEPGLMHHSDQGVQYACGDYIEVLNKHKFIISMSRKGNPYDNAMAESFMKTLKTEEVYINEYHDFSDAYANIERFIEIVYNNKRLHSSIGYRTPEEMEAEFYHKQSTLAISKSVSTEG